MSLSDEELMLLEPLTYLEDIVFEAAELEKRPLDSFETVGDLINYFNKVDPETGERDETHLAKLDGAGVLKYPNDPDNPDDDTDSLFLQGNEWAALIREIRDNEKLMSLAIYHTELYDKDDPAIKRARGSKSRIDYMVFCEKDGDDYNFDHAIVCFDGTLGPLEWKDNIRLLLSGDTEINQGLKDIIDNLPFKTITTVGHSKGANKAAYLYYKYEKVVYGVLMDCPGFPALFYDGVKEGIKKAEENHSLQQYAVDKDFVNIMLYRLMGAEYHYCQGFGQQGFAENHSPITFFPVLYNPHTNECRIVHNPDGSRLSFTEQDELMKKLNGFTMYVYDNMSEEEKDKVSDYLGHICVICLCLGPDDSYNVDGVVYTKADLGIFLFSDTDTLGIILTYAISYCQKGEMNDDKTTKALRELGGLLNFMDTYMLPEEREELAHFFENLITIALLAEGETLNVDGEDYGKKDKLKYILSNKEALPTVIAYIMVYFNRTDFGYDDIEGYIPFWGRFFIDLIFGSVKGLNFGPALADYKLNWLFEELKKGYKKGEFSTYFWVKWIEITTLVELFTDIEKQDLDDLLIMSRTKALEIEKNTSNFFPNTSITAPSTNVGTIEFGGIGGDGSEFVLPSLGPGTEPKKRGDIILGPGPLQSTDEESLYIDNPIFQLHRNNIRDAADKLILDTEAFNSEDEVCGTDSMLLLANYHHQVAETTENYRGLMINPVDTIMDKMAQSIIEVDEKCSNSLRVNTAY